ncbi:hypothetical protein B0H63DRAFT_468367 [Podospora didyma]|uniref:DUF1445 domain protein n=1 Tax=Podospora didyma TaxID=330526 RepID=A0AAE0NSB7_9PEZI|nr:hypothetical protein B0H63DRAFT_468367 [Podospora didyma]
MALTNATNNGRAVRLAARSNTLSSPTAGLAPSYLQANLIVLPRQYATDFRLLCARNPVPCPLLAESDRPGSFNELKSYIRHPSSSSPVTVASDIDLRTDAPKYRIYKDGTLAGEAADIVDAWQPENHVGFLIGCSYSFDDALSAAGLTPRYVAQGFNVPMYRTTVPLCPAGVFVGGTVVVSMRPYRSSDITKVRDITRAFVTTHGEPIAWGWEAVSRLGIADVGKPEWGDVPLTADGKRVFGCQDTKEEDDYVPVFWGCGVTPQEAVMRANLTGTVMGHAPGHMIVLDVQDRDVFPEVRG